MICLLAAVVIVVMFQFPAERAQLSEWIRNHIIHPVMNPIEGPQSNAPRNSPITAIPPVPVSPVTPPARPMVPQVTIADLQQLLIHRVEVLEELKERLLAEQLAAEIFMLSRFPKTVGVNYVEQGGGELAETVRLICESHPSSPGFSPDEQQRALPYLKIEDGELKQVSPEINIDVLLEKPANLSAFDTKNCDSSLRILERRLYVEESIQPRRYAQSIAAVVTAAQSTGIDFVAETGGNLDEIIAAVVEGRKIEDPESAFDGHVFKTPPPPADRLEEVKQFLKIDQNRIRYHEELPAELKIEQRFAPSDDRTQLQDAINVTESLLRSTAEQILVNRANRDKSLMPVRGLQQ